MKRFVIALALSVLALSVQARAAEPTVVTTITPLHSLTASVMRGVGTPTLLIRGGMSPHTYAMRPSDVQAIEQADVVIWFGAALETGLARAIRILPRGEVVTLMHTAPLTLLPVRAGGAWEEEDHDGHDHAHTGNDPHVWLDPRNAKVLAEHIAMVLSRTYPAHAERFAANAEALAARLDAAERDIAARLAPVGDAPYFVFHDAYQYFENRFGLRPAGSITVSPERAPGARRLTEVRERLMQSGARCVFREPQSAPKAVNTIIEGTPARVGVLDPLGADLTPGPDAYFQLLQQLADGLTGCLGPH